jgi:hypothetical protein
MARKAKHASLSLSYRNAQRIEECARHSGYSLEKMYSRIGQAVVEGLGIDPKEAAAFVMARQGHSVTVFVDTINLNGFLDEVR